VPCGHAANGRCPFHDERTQAVKMGVSSSKAATRNANSVGDGKNLSLLACVDSLIATSVPSSGKGNAMTTFKNMLPEHEPPLHELIKHHPPEVLEQALTMVKEVLAEKGGPEFAKVRACKSAQSQGSKVV